MPDLATTTALCWARCEDVELGIAIQDAAACLGEDAVALLYSATACTVAAVADGARLVLAGGSASLDGVFEARMFGAEAELRWLNAHDGKGRAVLLFEDTGRVTPPTGWAVQRDDEVTDSIVGQYILWGPGAERSPAAGWSTLASAKIGTIEVPIANVGKRHVCIRVIEYLHVEDGHGNIGVLDERLVGLEVL